MSIFNELYISNIFTYLILPLSIFIARILDVTIGTIRIVMVSKGHKFLAPLLGFFEVLIWLVAMAKIFENLENWICFIAYAGGFATGNYIGLIVEERLALGIVRIQIITRKEAFGLIEKLKNAGYGITHQKAQGSSKKVHIIYSIIKRTDIKKVEDIIALNNPNAFYTIDDIKFVNKGIFPIPIKHYHWRKGK